MISLWPDDTHASLLLIFQGDGQEAYGDNDKAHHSVDYHNYRVDEPPFHWHVWTRCIPFLTRWKKVAAANFALLLKPPELHEDKVEHEEEGGDKSKDAEGDGQSLMIETLGP